MTDWKARQTSPLSRRVLRSGSVALVLALLWGCGAAPTRDNQTDTPVTIEPTELPETTDISLDLPPSLFGMEFYRADQALAAFDWMEASVILDALPREEFMATDSIYVDYLQARIAFLQGDQKLALEKLDSHNSNTPELIPALRYRLLSFKQYILALQGDHLESAHTANQLLSFAPRDLAAHWKRTVWLNLQRSAKSALQAARLETTDEEWLAWLDLALLTRTNTYTLGHELNVWLGNNPQHIAANPLPGGLQTRLGERANPGRVALLLPLNGRFGPAGKAVMEGYLAAHYAARASGGAAYDVMVINTAAFDTASAAYAEAVRNRAALVVGPLSKDAVADLALELSRPVPILALNRVDADIPLGESALVQLSLTAEDEAATIAHRAFGTGARNAIVVRPDTDWGSELEQALTETWANLGGTISATATYVEREDQSNSVKAALGLHDSERRAQKIESILNEPIEFTPRRRQDPDVVFLLARNAAQGRSIKPLLAYHYAATLPVFGISSLYSGSPDKRDRDLNGTQLVETPWLLGENSALQAAIAAGETGSDRYTRLNALGAEAFLLQSEFQRLGSGADTLIRGNTGLLTMDPRLQIRRELSPATFDKGVLVAQ